MTDSRDELLVHYRRSRDEMAAAIKGLSDDQMTEPSIDGWSVKDHLLHIALWDDLRAAEVARISAGHDSAGRMSDEQDAAFSAIGYQLRSSLSVSQARWEFDTSRKRLIEAIRGATPRGLDGSLYGEAALKSTHEVVHAGWISRWRAEKSY